MNSQLAKRIRKYAKLRGRDEHMSEAQIEIMYKELKKLYENSPHSQRVSYDMDMDERFAMIIPDKKK